MFSVCIARPVRRLKCLRSVDENHRILFLIYNYGLGLIIFWMRRFCVFLDVYILHYSLSEALRVIYHWVFFFFFFFFLVFFLVFFFVFFFLESADSPQKPLDRFSPNLACVCTLWPYAIIWTSFVGGPTGSPDMDPDAKTRTPHSYIRHKYLVLATAKRPLEVALPNYTQLLT